MAKINTPTEFGDTEKAEILIVKFLPNIPQKTLFGRPTDKIIRESLEKAGLMVDFSMIYFTSLVDLNFDEDAKGAARTKSIKENCEHLDLVMVRLKNLKVVITLGVEVKDHFCKDKVSLTKSIGKGYKKDFGYGEVTLLTSFSEKAAFNFPEKFESKFVGVFGHAKNVFNGEMKSAPYRVGYLSCRKFIDYADRLMSYYKAGEIDSIAFDIESSNSYGSKDSLTSLAHDPSEYITGFSLADSKEDIGYYVNIYHPMFAKSLGEDIARNEEKLVKKKLVELLQTIPIYCHNSKFDLLWCVTKIGLDLRKVTLIDDTLALAFLLIGARRDTGIDLGLKPLCKLYFGFNESWDEAIDIEMLKFNRIDDRRLTNIPFKVLSDYGGMDSIAMLHLRNALREQIELPENQEIQEAYNLLLKAIITFTDIETRFVPIHEGLIKYLSGVYTQETKRLSNALRSMPQAQQFLRNIAIEENPGASDELIAEKTAELSIPVKGKRISQFLFDHLGLPGHEDFKTDKGANSLNREARMHWVKKAPHDFQREAVGYLTKSIEITDQISKYLLPMANQIMKFGGYYTDYRLTSVSTGRLGSPFHTLPSFGDIKYLVVSDWGDEGGLVMAPDYSQVEVRVMASLSGDEDLRQAYLDGLDIHKFVASKTFNTPYEDVTKLQRSYAKTVIFGMLYGESVWTLAEKLGKKEAEAQGIQDAVFNRFPKIKKWITKTISDGEKKGYVTSRLGRRRSLKALKDYKGSRDQRERKLYNMAVRAAMNHPIQSTASDITLSSIVRLHREFQDQNMQTRFIGTVHDSLELSIHPSEILKAIRLVKYCCEEDLQERYDWLNGVPYRIDIEMGASWGNCIDVEFMEDDLSDDEAILELSGRDLGYDSFIKQMDKNEHFNCEVLSIERENSVAEVAEDRVFHGIIYPTSTQKVTAKVKLTRI